MKKLMGVEYGRGATAQIVEGGPALAPRAVKNIFPENDWSIITANPVSKEECLADRFGENYKIQQKIYSNTPKAPHVLIGGDHSVNFGHFSALADNALDKDICLVYIDAHLDIHTPESSKAEASGAPHGTNVRALLGEGDKRWLSLQNKTPALKPENVFYLATRSYENSEINFVRDNNIFCRAAKDLKTQLDWENAVKEIKEKINNRPFIVSFDFDALDPSIFNEVLVPEPNGISLEAAKYFLNEFKDALSFEFVEYAPNGDKNCEDVAKQLISISLE